MTQIAPYARTAPRAYKQQKLWQRHLAWKFAAAHERSASFAFTCGHSKPFAVVAAFCGHLRFLVARYTP
jgi:hypothetical protein